MLKILLAAFLFTASATAGYAAFGIFMLGTQSVSGQNVIDDNSVLVVDDNAVQVVSS